MKRLWKLLIIVFVTAAVTFVILNHHRHKSSELTPAGNPNRPERIVSLAPNLTEILFALGLNERIIAVSSDSDWPPATADKKKLGTFWQPSTEAVIACQPDLVITLWFEQQRAVAETLTRLGLAVLTLRIEKIAELWTAIKEIGTAAGHRQEADKLVEDINRKLKDLEAKLGSVNKVKVLWVIQNEPLQVVGRNTFINEMIEMAGGENAIGATIQQYPSIGSEEILVCAAEVIIQSAMGAENIGQQQEAAKVFWSRFSNLPAVANSRIYVIESDTVLRLGPRLAEGVETIARCLHPEIFQIQPKTNTF